MYACVFFSSKQTGETFQKTFLPSSASREKPRVATLLHLQHTQKVPSHYEVVIEKEEEGQTGSDDTSSSSSYHGPGRGGMAVTNAFARLENVTVFTSLQDALNYDGSAPFTLKLARRQHQQLRNQVHPDKGGVVDAARATRPLAVLNRALEQCEIASLYQSWQRSGYDILHAKSDPDFVIPAELLYSVRAYSRIEELAEISSHGAEASMSTALRTGIRNFEPLAMIMACAEFAKRKIEKMMGDANNWKGVVPPSVQEHIGKHIEKAEVYEGQVEAIPGSNMYEYNVEDSDGPKRVVLSPTMTQTPPECCAYSQMGNGFPCLHSIAVIVEKHGPGNVYKFIDERYLTQAWKSTYDGIEVRTPAQHSIGAAMRAAKDRVISGDYLLGPKALAPPRGRPVKNAGTRRKSYYERASGSKDARSYRCRLCRKAGHTRSTCKNQQGEGPDPERGQSNNATSGI